jgi:hypothetical protein
MSKKNYTKDFQNLTNVAFMGGLVTNTAGIMTGKNPMDVASGNLQIGIAAGVSNAAFNIISGKKRRLRK